MYFKCDGYANVIIRAFIPRVNGLANCHLSGCGYHATGGFNSEPFSSAADVNATIPQTWVSFPQGPR